MQVFQIMPIFQTRTRSHRIVWKGGLLIRFTARDKAKNREDSVVLSFTFKLQTPLKNEPEDSVVSYLHWIRKLRWQSPGSDVFRRVVLSWINSCPPSAACMRRWAGSALVQIMACLLDGAKSFSKPMLTYCQLDSKEYISMKLYLKLKYFQSRKCVWICLRNGGHFVQGGELSHFHDCFHCVLSMTWLT